MSFLLKMTIRHSILCLTFKVELAVFLLYGAKNILISEYLKDFFFLTAANFWLFLLKKKWHFGIIPLSFTIRTFLVIIPKASQTKFHQIRITKSKVIIIYVQIPVLKWEKKKAGKIFLGNKGINGIQGNNGKRGNKGIANWSGFRFRAVLGIQSKYRSKRDFKSEQGLQISKEQSWC